MYKIIFSNTPTVKNAEMTKTISDPAVLRKADGLVSEDTCLAYLDEANADLLTGGGQIRLRFDESSGRLIATTEYTAEKKLTVEQLEALKDDTRGQWSDGVGSSCFDEFDHREGLHIELVSLENYGRETIEQSEVNDKPKGRRIPNLAAAAEKGDLDKLRKGILAGGDLNAIGRHGFTPLITAITYAQEAAALLLVEAGADVNRPDKQGHTPTGACASTRDLTDESAARIAQALVGAGADVSVPDPDLEETPLSMALAKQRFRLARVLLNGGAKEGRVSEFRTSALMGVAYSALSDEESTEFAHRLIEQGCDANHRQQDGVTRIFGKNALEIALERNKPELAELLRQHTT